MNLNILLRPEGRQGHTQDVRKAHGAQYSAASQTVFLLRDIAVEALKASGGTVALLHSASSTVRAPSAESPTGGLKCPTDQH